jgi:carboxyl-terminal processing protease
MAAVRFKIKEVIQMTFRGKLVLISISMAIVIFAFVGGWLGTTAQQPINDAGAQMRIFESVLQHIQNDYVDEPNLEKVRAGALRGLAYGLDPYSSYLTSEQVKDYQSKKPATSFGIGAEFSQVSGFLYLISVVKGSPADQAGLKAGDAIEYIETKATRDVSLYDARQLLQGEQGSKVKLRVLRSGVKPQTIVVTRNPFKTPDPVSRIETGKIGVITIYSLQEGESALVKNYVQGLIKQGVQKIVLDLRGVSDGSIQEAVNVANLFIKDGTLAEILGRENTIVKTFTADPGKFLFDGKVVALIDLGTSSSGEVVASALLDRKRGEVIGEKSFGAGTEQQLFTLREGDGLLLTVAKWASPTGKPFLANERADSGVKPSIEVKRPDSLEPVDPSDLADQGDGDNPPAPKTNPEQPPGPKSATEDIQMKKALEVLQEKAAAAGA